MGSLGESDGACESSKVTGMEKGVAETFQGIGYARIRMNLDFDVAPAPVKSSCNIDTRGKWSVVLKLTRINVKGPMMPETFFTKYEQGQDKGRTTGVCELEW